MVQPTLFKAVPLPKPRGMAKSWGHKIDIYQSDREGKKWRTSLGMDAENPLIIIGLNPSDASDQKSDRTITRIKEFAYWHGFGGFVMLNLSAQRNKDPSKLSVDKDLDLHLENIHTVRGTMERYKDPHILAVWGENINIRPYLAENLKEIVTITIKKSATWLQIGPNGTRGGHPLHPGRRGYFPFYHFDVQRYLLPNSLKDRSFRPLI